MRNDGLSFRLSLAFFDRSDPDALAFGINHVVLILDELDRLLLFELLHSFGKSNVEDLAAMRWPTRGVEAVHDIYIDRWRGDVFKVGVGVGRVGDGVRSALEHVVLAGNFRAVGE